MKLYLKNSNGKILNFVRILGSGFYNLTNFYQLQETNKIKGELVAMHSSCQSFKAQAMRGRRHIPTVQRRKLAKVTKDRHLGDTCSKTEKKGILRESGLQVTYQKHS